MKSKSTTHIARFLCLVLFLTIVHSMAHAQATGKSLSFDGINDYVELSGDNDFGLVSNFQGDFTFEAWVYNDGTQTRGRVFDFGDSTNDYIFFTPIAVGGNSRFAMRIGGGSEFRVDGGVFPTGWTHVTCRLSAAGEASILFNGSVVASATGWPQINNLVGTTRNYLGKSQFDDPYFKGKMKEVRVWREHRSTALINEWMNCEISGDEPNLTLYHKMNQGIVNANNNGLDAFANNYGFLSQYASRLLKFALTGTSSNWVSDAPPSFNDNVNSRNAIEFYGTPEYITLGNEANFDFESEYSIQFWMNNTTDLNLLSLVLQKGNLSGKLSFFMDFNRSSLFFGQDNGAGYRYWTTAQVPPPNKWTHITLTAKEENGGLLSKIYYDGVLQAQRFEPNFQIPQTNEQVILGAGEFYGKLANIKFWDRALSDSEISSDYGSVSLPGTPNLVSQYSTYNNNLLLGLIDDLGNNPGTRTGVPVFITDPCFVKFEQEPQDQQLSSIGAALTLTTDIGEVCNDSYYTYQWTKDGIDIPGANSLIYSVTNASPSDLGTYQCIVTACGQDFPTREAIVTVDNQGKVLHFDGVDDYVSFADLTGASGSYTVEGRVRFDEKPFNMNIIANYQPGSDQIYSQLAISKDGYFQHNTYDQTAVSVTTVKHPVTIEAHKWYNVAIKYNGSQHWIEVEDVESPRVTRTGSTPSVPEWNIGKKVLSFQAFKGEVDEVRIWLGEVSTIVGQPTVLSDPNLIHYFQFDEGVAEADNFSPTPIDNLQDPYSGAAATLHNFSLNGNTSNWLGCDIYDGNIDISVPSRQLITLGNQLELEAIVGTPDGSETFQWYRNGVAIPGATAALYQVSSTTITDEGRYIVEVGRFNACSTFSSPADVFIKGSGEVLNFDGVNDHIVIPSGTYESEYTVEAWIKFTDEVANQNIIVATSDEGALKDHSHQLYTDEDGYLIHRTFVENGATIFLKAFAPALPNTWYHVAIRASQSVNGAQLLIDGVVQSSASTNGTMWTGQSKWMIGSEATTYIPSSNSFIKRKFFKGELDELRIWGVWRGDNEIIQEKDRELESGSQAGLTHYLKMNRGEAGGNNKDLDLSYVPNYIAGTYTVPERGIGRLVNFAMNGSFSNFISCSPVSTPDLRYILDGGTPHIGQTLDFKLEITTGDTSELNFQWLLDGSQIPGATQPLYNIENMTAEDFGLYEVIVSDMCSPQYVDTLTVESSPQSNLCFINNSNAIDFPATKRYEFCTDPESSGSLCNSGPLYITRFEIDKGYCNSEVAYLGQEITFHIPLAEARVVDLRLSNITEDVDMWLFGDDCNVDNCLASSTKLFSEEEFIRIALPAGDYYLLIDQKEVFDEGGGNDSLILDIEMYDNKCSFSRPLTCSESTDSTTVDGSNFIDTYGSLMDYTGSEQVYELTIAEPTTITATLSNLSADLDIFLLNEMCDEVNVLVSSTQSGQSDDQFSYGLQPGTYYLVVDGKNGATGNYTLDLQCANYFDASVDETDAYIDLKWSIDKKACVPQDTGIIVRLITTPNTILYEEEYTTAALTPDVITGEFRHLVGTDHTRMYVLRVYNRLSDKTICEEIKTGSTLSFQQPEIISISQAEAPDTIKIEWRNHSQLSDEFRIYRDGFQIASLADGYTEDSIIVSYVDRHNMNISSSIDEASSYNYCIETFNSELDQSYQQVCATGSTYDINFSASDGGTTDKVTLTWNDVSAFSDGLIVSRNGIQQEMLSANETFYNDLNPIHGIPAEYKLTILRKGDEKIMVTDDGFVEANGVVSGRAVTEEGDYPVQGALVTLTKDTLISNTVQEIEIATTSTNLEGRFSFSGIVYRLASDFNIRLTKAGSDFTPEVYSFELNSLEPQIEDVLFIDNADVIVTAADLLDTFRLDIQQEEDLIVANWDYTFSSTEITHFILKRNGVIIYDDNDSQGKITSFTDFTGVPGLSYNYTLDAFRYSGNDIESHVRTATGIYPVLTPVQGFDFTLDGQENLETGEMVGPKITFDWSASNHPSQNFDGFRIFRNNILIGEILRNEGEIYSVIVPPAIEAGYEMRTFRKINGVTYESSSFPAATDSLIAALPLWKPKVLDDGLTSDRSVVLDIDPFATPAEFYSEGTYTGVILERKLQGEDDSTFETVDELTKEFIVAQAEAQQKPLIWDAFGIPGANYTYKFSTYLDLNGTRYKRDTTFNRTCPEITGPSNLQKIEEVGRVGLTWEDNSVEQGLLSQLYFNYSGYELTRTDITNVGDPELIATLPGSLEKYSDFISNPVFNLFFNNYVHTEYEYALRGYIDINNTRYYSAPLTINAAPLDGTTSEPLPTNFTASKDIPNHIKLCWDWFATKQSKFIVYRDTIAIDTLPTTARAYYDYDAPSDPSVIYRISSLFNGNESQQVMAEGRLPSNMKIHGRITNTFSGVGISEVNVTYRNLGNSGLGIEAGEFSGSTVTDATGNYYFNVPHTPGYPYEIKIFSNNYDFSESETTFQSFDSESITISSEKVYSVNFLEYSEPDVEEVVSPIAAVSAVANADSMFVEIAWSPEHGYYDGFQVYRVNQLIAEVKKGEGFIWKDRGGFPGIDYVYTVRAYKSEEGGRDFSEHVAAKTTYPSVLPVENLTVTAFGEMNKMLVAWSHPLDNHDFYRVRRNGEFAAVIPTGEQMMWYDETGIPGIEYQYEVTAIKGANISVPVVVTKNFKGVAEVRELRLEINEFVPACSEVLTNDNHVTISWNYNSGAADGFEIYRDGELIGEIDSVTLAYGNLPLIIGDTLMTGSTAYYDDYEGEPGLSHTYHVLAYVIREGGRYVSGVEELVLQESIVYPVIAEVRNLDVAQNNILGSAEINFAYPSFIAKGFQILRDGVAIDTVVEANEGSYTFQDFTGIPGIAYTYAVRAYDVRNGTIYLGAISCNETIVYPIVPTPQNFSASQGTFENHILVDWDFSLEAFVDSFYLENMTLGTLETFGAGRRKFIDVVNDFEDEKYEYRIRASRINQGQTIFSEWSDIVEGWSSRQITGSEDAMINNDLTTSLNGFSVDIDGEWAVSGAPNGRESIYIYRRVNGGWSLYQSIASPYDNENVNFGLAVAISGNTIVAGIPNKNNGAIAIYRFDGERWNENPQLLSSPGPGNFGWSVDIDGDDIIVGNPLWDAGVGVSLGAIYWYERNDNDFWVFIRGLGGNEQLGFNDVRRFGHGVAIHDGFSAASWDRPGANFSEVLGFVKNGSGDWVFNGYFSANAYAYNANLSQDNIDYNDEVLVIGDPVYADGTGRCIVVELENNATVSSTTIVGPYGPGSQFGHSVAVNKVHSPIDEKMYVAVGAPTFRAEGIEIGTSLLYSNVSGSFNLVDEISNDNPSLDDLNGWSVSLSDDAWAGSIVRDDAMEQGSVTFKNLLKAPSNVEATDGISVDFDPTETTVSWEFNGNYDILAGFNIYRDEEFLTYRDKATMTLVGQNLYTDSWNDNSGEAGLPYVYAVKSVNNLIPFESYGTSDEGYNRANGKIIGAVKTQMGLVPVPGVTITATGLVDGEVYTYTTTTQPNGEYVFNSVYYDPDETVLTEYKVTAEFRDHVIVPQTTDIAYLNPLSDPTQGVVDFFDVTAYVIRGNVAQPGVICPLEGLKIIQEINGVPAAGQEAFTDEEGNYSLVVNPFADGLQEIKVVISNELTVDEVTTRYDFRPDGPTTFTNFESFPLITDLNYTDALTYNVSLKVKNTCNDAISTGKWRVRVRTLDGCFDEVYNTNSQGNLEVALIPQNYTMQVVGVDVPSSLNQQALDYFANFPVRLDLLDLHREFSETLTVAEIEAEAARQFTFHKAAQIEVNGFNDIICNTQTAILQQGVPYTLSFDIFENHNGTDCPVQEGIVVVTNPAAQNSDPVTIPYNEVTERFDDYSFVTGGPNQIFPHAYAVTFDYKTEDGIFLGRLTRVVFVEGSVSLPGTDILVDPASGNDAVPYPLLVLRDPPGDQSSSYIAAEQTISFETEMTMEEEFGAKLYTEISTEVFGNGTEVNAAINGGYTSEETISLSNSVTTATTISTSDDEDNIGREADVIVGTGMVMQFGYIVEYRVDADECSKIQKVTKYGISPNAATTTWSYQVGQIEEIIQGYRNDSIRVEQGTLIIERFGKPLTTAEARVFLSSNINNWTQVLRYHDVETVPYYYLCTLDPFAAGGALHAQQIGYWQAQIRPFFGRFVNNEFVLNDDIIWDDQLINIYNAASAAIRNLLQGGDLSIWSFPYVGNQNGVDLNVPLGDFSLVDLVSILRAPSLTNYTNSFGQQVKNITTGGNVLIEESINNAQASTTSMSSSIYVGSELDIAVVLGGSSEIVVGTFAGVGGGVTFATVQELFETEVKIGTAIETSFTRSNSYASTLEESVEVGYSIFDDDNSDAFSFAVVQAVTPNSTPYFDYFGGHSSCPPEDGSVFVDAPRLGILSDDGEGSSPTKELNNVPADEAATFTLVAENASPIASQPVRELEIYMESSSNPNGAIVTLNGVSLNNSSFIDSFAVGEPVELVLTIERGPTEYDYPDIQIGIEPTCGEGPREYVYASAYFVNPCSPVTLVAPVDNWLINDDTSKLVVAMQDYDTLNPFFVDATLQYRRVGAGQPWTDVPGLELERGNFITRDSLAANDKEFAAGQIPKYFFVWTIPTTEGAYPDGDYEVRTVMQCNNFSSTTSNVIKGKIARNGLNLFGSPQPSDGLWTEGDEISFTFNKDLDCALITPSFVEENVSVINESTGMSEPFTLSCYGNKLIFIMDNPMSTYDGQFLTINVDNIPSLEGNISLPYSWTFRVITQKVYWADADTVKLRMYQDDVRGLDLRLENSTLNETLNGLSLVADDGDLDSWLTILDPTDPTFAVNPSGRTISIEVDASQPVGIYNETLNVLGVEAFGNTPQVHIQLEVLVKPPNWVIDSGDFSTSMNMIANWKYESDPDGTISEDIADLISVWVGNEIRGVAPISEAGEFFASYLTIYGGPEDGADTELEFRIWDADRGVEYDGHPSDPILYLANSNRGTTANPEILEVDEQYDAAKYIALRQGWTGFSLPDSTTNMQVVHKLRSLETVSEGDLIVTGDKFSKYSTTLGWFNFGASNLSVIDNNEGYMIYLQNGPDTLRVTGITASANDIELRAGWNWIGFPFQNPESLNDVLNLNTANATGNDRIKIDFPLPDETATFANYNLGDDNWNDGNMTQMEPNNLYKLFSGHPNGAILSWTPQNNEGKKKGGAVQRSMPIVADPDDALTWTMPDFDTDEVMPVFAEVIVDGGAANDPADMVAFFEADTIRALGSITEISALMKWEVSLLAEKSSALYDIRYYDASEGVVMQSTNELSFDMNGVGSVLVPYEIQFSAIPCPDMMMISAGSNAFAQDKTFSARQEIRVEGSLSVPAGVNIILDAPIVRIMDELDLGNGANVIVRPDGCN